MPRYKGPRQTKSRKQGVTTDGGTVAFTITPDPITGQLTYNTFYSFNAGGTVLGEAHLEVLDTGGAWRRIKSHHFLAETTLYASFGDDGLRAKYLEIDGTSRTVSGSDGSVATARVTVSGITSGKVANVSVDYSTGL